MKKSILFVINSLCLGGAEKSLTSLLSAFDYDKYDVDLLMFRAEGMFLKLLPKEVNVLPELDFFKNNSISAQLKHPNYLVSHLRASIGLRINNRKHILHASQCYWKYAGKAFDAIEKKYDVAIAWGQGNPTHYVADKVRAEKKITVINVNYEAAGYEKKIDYPFYQKYAYIVAVSDELASIIGNVFPDFKHKIRTVYDVNNAVLIEKMASAFNPFEDYKSELFLVTAGRLEVQKGYDLAIEAAKKLKDKGIDFKWFFVGEGSCRGQLEAMIADYKLSEQVILVGAQENPYVYMKNADIYVQTSRFEGYCLTLCEARILNKPVISTNFDVVYNQIRDGENGLIVDMNPTEISDAIEHLSDDKALQEHIVANLKKEKKGNLQELNKLYQLIEY